MIIGQTECLRDIDEKDRKNIKEWGGHPGPPLSNSLTPALSQRERGKIVLSSAVEKSRLFVTIYCLQNSF